MFCGTCAKLAILFTNRNCLKCSKSITTNISVICDACSVSSQTCSACLKRLNNSNTIIKSKSGCKSCGGK